MVANRLSEKAKREMQDNQGGRKCRSPWESQLYFLPALSKE